MQEYKYFVIPYDSVQKEAPGLTYWYATWSTEPPRMEPGMSEPMVVGFAAAERVPDGATILAGTVKEPPIPPPPPPAVAVDTCKRYQESFEAWLARRRSL